MRRRAGRRIGPFVRAQPPFQVGDRALGLGQFVLKKDDPRRRGHRQARVHQCPGTGGEIQLMTGVPPVSTCRALWHKQTGVTEATQEIRGDIENLGRGTHAVRGVMDVVDPARVAIPPVLVWGGLVRPGRDAGVMIPRRVHPLTCGVMSHQIQA